MPKRKPIIPLTAERAEEEGRKLREAKRLARRNEGMRTEVSTVVTGDDWEYIIKRVEGLSSLAAVVAVAEARGEVLTRQQSQDRAIDTERRLGGQVEQQIRGKVLSDEDFEAWTRMKVEQLIATPGPNTQGVIRAIQYLKKAREEGKARNPEALMKLVIECANRIAELDRLEAEAVRRGQKAQEPATTESVPVNGEYGSQ